MFTKSCYRCIQPPSRGPWYHDANEIDRYDQYDQWLISVERKFNLKTIVLGDGNAQVKQDTFNCDDDCDD